MSMSSTGSTHDRAASPSVLSTRRPEPASAWAASLAFEWRALLKIRHVPEQLTDVFAIPIIFTVVFTYLFGGAMAGSPSAYLRFVLPGTLVMTVLLVTSSIGIGLNTDLGKGVFDRFRSMPIWQPAPIVGSLIGELARYAIAATVVIAMGFVMGFRPEGGIAGVALAMALVLEFAFALSWVWTTLALALRSPTAVTAVGLLVQFPLTLVSNVFVDPATLPGWLRAFVDVNPVSHVVSAVRSAMQGTAEAGEIGWVLSSSAVLFTVFAPLTMHLYRNR